MRIHRSIKPLEKLYTLNKQVLTQVDKAKYLAVMIPEYLEWNPHINSIITKANKCIASSKEISAITHKNSES